MISSRRAGQKPAAWGLALLFTGCLLDAPDPSPQQARQAAPADTCQPMPYCINPEPPRP